MSRSESSKPATKSKLGPSKNGGVYPPQPDMVSFIVRYENGRLQFADGLSVDRERATCDSDGNMTVSLRKEVGYVQKISVMSDQDDLRFICFCAGAPRSCVHEGHVKSTPFVIEMIPDGKGYSGFILSVVYLDNSSLGAFNYEMFFETQDGLCKPHDPQIRNQGTSGPPDADRRW